MPTIISSRTIYMMIPTSSWPSGKGVAAVTSATRVRFALGRTIYNAWVSGKKMKTLFFYQKKKYIYMMIVKLNLSTQIYMYICP